MTRQQPLSLTALIITVLLTGANVSAFVPANYRNPSLGQSKKVVDAFPGSQFAFALKNGNAPASSSSSERQSSSTSTSLQMVAPTGAALAAITGAMTGGLFAGGLHAMSGKLNDVICNLVLCYVVEEASTAISLKSRNNDTAIG
jgi:hypothetical protein